MGELSLYEENVLIDIGFKESDEFFVKSANRATKLFVNKTYNNTFDLEVVRWNNDDDQEFDYDNSQYFKDLCFEDVLTLIHQY